MRADAAGPIPIGNQEQLRMTTKEAKRHAPAPAGRPAWRRHAPLLLLLAAMATVYALGLHRYLSLDALLEHHATIDQFVSENRGMALLGFAAAYAASVALSLPGASLLTLLGGFLFGAWIGGAVSVLAATTGAVGVFLVARSALGEILQRKAGPALARILSGFKNEAVSYLLFLRLVPAFPFWLVNLAAALGGVSLPVFAWTTLLGIVPGTLALSFAGNGLDSVIAAQAEARAACAATGAANCETGLSLKSVLTPELLAGLVLLGCVALIPMIWRRISKHRTARQGGQS
jgi:uncharacterized membrane protein YdjX (TVP38/TMEM64 family)